MMGCKRDSGIINFSAIYPTIIDVVFLSVI